MSRTIETALVSRDRLVDLVVFVYRSLVIRRLGVTAEWRVLEWIDFAACADQTEATPDTCQRCPVMGNASLRRWPVMIVPMTLRRSSPARPRPRMSAVPMVFLLGDQDHWKALTSGISGTAR